MISLIRANVIRFILLIIVQFILKGVDYINIDIYIYPLFILLLPLNIIDGVAILICFFYGLCIDAFYNTVGLYASAAVFLAAIRPIVLSIMEPRGGYEVGKAATKANYGLRWFLQYSGVLMFLHTFWVVSLEELTLLSTLWLLKMLSIFTLSMLLIIMYQYVFNPKE